MEMGSRGLFQHHRLGEEDPCSQWLMKVNGEDVLHFHVFHALL